MVTVLSGGASSLHPDPTFPLLLGLRILLSLFLELCRVHTEAHVLAFGMYQLTFSLLSAVPCKFRLCGGECALQRVLGEQRQRAQLPHGSLVLREKPAPLLNQQPRWWLGPRGLQKPTAGSPTGSPFL